MEACQERLNRITYDPAKALLYIYPVASMSYHRGASAFIFIAALFTVARRWVKLDAHQQMMTFEET